MCRGDHWSPANWVIRVPIAGFSNPRADLKIFARADHERAPVGLLAKCAPASRACGAGQVRRATPANTKGSPIGEPFVLAGVAAPIRPVLCRRHRGWCAFAARRSGSGSRSETFTRRRASETSPKAKIQLCYFFSCNISKFML